MLEMNLPFGGHSPHADVGHLGVDVLLLAVAAVGDGGRGRRLGLGSLCPRLGGGGIYWCDGVFWFGLLLRTRRDMDCLKWDKLLWVMVRARRCNLGWYFLRHKFRYAEG